MGKERKCRCLLVDTRAEVPACRPVFASTFASDYLCNGGQKKCQKRSRPVGQRSQGHGHCLVFLVRFKLLGYRLLQFLALSRHLISGRDLGPLTYRSACLRASFQRAYALTTFSLRLFQGKLADQFRLLPGKLSRFGRSVLCLWECN